jgi:hypothetical protein
LSPSVVKFVGLVRDAIMAIGGVLIVFGVTGVTDKKIAGIVAIVAPIIALASFIWSNVNSPKGSV